MSLSVECGGGGGSTITRSVNQPPKITSTSSTTFTVGVAGLFTVTATGSPAPALSENGVLPSGVAFNAASGQLAGTPAPGAAGTYSITFTASNGVGTDAAQSFTLTVENPPPMLVSISPSTVNAGSPNTTLTVGGTGFTTQSAVTLNATTLGTSFVNSTQLTAVAPAAKLASAGSLSLAVMSPAPGGGTSGTLKLTVLIVVIMSPTAETLNVGQTQQFTATVVGSTNQGITWSVNGIVNGSTAVGTISTTGLYTAPGVPPAPNTVTVRAASVSDPTRTASAAITVVNPLPTLTSVLPTAVDSGSGDTTLIVKGSAFTSQSVIEAGGTSLSTTVTSSSELTATLPAALLVNAGPLSITVTTPTPGGGTSAGIDIQILTVVNVSPTTATTLTGQTQQFTASVGGTTNQNVTWSIDGAGTGNSTVGTISSSGLYTAPAVVPNPPNVTVRATSEFDNTGFATTAVTLASPVEDWPKYRHDLSNTGRSGETGLSSGNVNLLALKWKFLTGGKVSASPAVATISGTSMVFVGSWDGVFHALDAASGTELWSFPIDPAPNSGSCANGAVDCTRIATSAAVAGGIVYFGAGNGHVYALDAATGAKVWGTQLGDPTAGVEIWASPAISNGLVFEAVGSHNDSPCVPGQVVALDASTGAVVWTWLATDPNVPGVGIWSSPAVDISVNPALVYIGTGNPGMGCSPPATATPSFSYPDGIVALDSTNGTLKTYSPSVTSDTNDCCDFGSSPVLHQTPGGTGNISWVTEANKDGDVFTFPIGSSGVLSTSQGAVDLGSLNSGEVIASPAVQPGSTSSDANTVYLPSDNDTLFVLQQASDGSVSVQSAVTVNPTSAYCSTLGNCPLFSAPASTTDIVLFGGGEGNFYAFDAAGNKVFSFGTYGLVASGPAISHSRVYVGSYDGYIYCLSINGK